MRARRVKCIEHRALLVGCQQGSDESCFFMALLCQKLAFVLEKTVPLRALYFGHHAGFTVIALATVQG
ncbi:hypothetical protein D3C73_1652150 [compost metagenome]